MMQQGSFRTVWAVAPFSPRDATVPSPLTVSLIVNWQATLPSVTGLPFRRTWIVNLMLSPGL
jgi:hypothetical protein